MNNIIYILKGFAIGLSMLVPGVSGGTMAIILGVYDKIIRAISSFRKNKKKNIYFLGSLALGGIVGIGAFSQLIYYLLDNFEFPMTYLFLGIILGGVPILYQRAVLKKKKKSDVLYLSIGVIIIIIMSIYTGTIIDLADSIGILNFIFLFLVGIIMAVALILPGISTSFFLLVIGLYDITLEAINKLDLNYIIPIGIGIIMGVLATTKTLERLMDKRPRSTYMVILGFVLGSVIGVFPGTPKGLDIVFSTITFVVGFIAIRYISEKYSE